MANGTVNKVILIGRLGRKPEIRHTPSGMVITTLNIATNDGYKDKNTGQFVDTTEWHRAKVFGQQAETLGTYANKGQLVYIEGRLRTSRWQDQSGKDRYTTEIIVTQTQMIGGKSDAENLTTSNYRPLEIAKPSDETISPVNTKTENTKVTESVAAVKTNIPDIDKIQNVDLEDDDIPF